MKQIIRVFYPGRGTGNFPMMIDSLVRNAEKPIQVTVKEFKPPKTLAQNNYFHGVVVPTIARELGKPVYVIRESLKLAFLPQVQSIIDPEKWAAKSLADISKPDYVDFIEECLAWAAEQGIHIPSPDERRQGEA